MKRLLILLVATVVGCLPLTVSAQHTRASLVLSATAAKPGDTVMAGVRLKMDAGWHTYWINGGDSGDPTKLKWTLPPGITAGEIQWPTPEKAVTDDLYTYQYHDEVMLLVPLTVGATASKGSIDIKANVSWLECEVACVPGDADVDAKLEIADATKPGPAAATIESWQKKVPSTKNDELKARAAWSGPASGKKRRLIIEWTLPEAPAKADFFPFAGKDFDIGGDSQKVSLTGGKVHVEKEVQLTSKDAKDWPKKIAGVLATLDKSGKPLAAWEASLTLEVTTAKSDAAPAAGESTASTSLLAMLGFAFLGGLILNIMPCVLPVIALKVFSFVKQGGEEGGRARQLSLIYALGILTSFVVLAGFLIAAQRAGDVVSWGMQMQNKSFVIGMTIVVALVALNLFGLFEVTLSGGAMSAADALTQKTGTPGAFFNGVLATALAIPCTASILAGAVTFALAQPPSIILLTFSFIALGLAAPYIVLTWNPKLLKFLPKPGPWMLRFKVLLGFPMLATVVWLYKLSLNHLDKSQGLWFGIFLVTLGMAAWVWGEFVQRGSTRRVVAALTSLMLLGAVGAYASTRGEGIQWLAWSEAAVQKARAAGRPVLVDFTADWCVTCQVNLRTSIDVAKVRAKLADVNAVTLIGDYSLKNPDIAQALHRFGRDAVPLVIVFPKNPTAEPMILPPVLKPQLVIDALEKAAK